MSMLGIRRSGRVAGMVQASRMTISSVLESQGQYAAKGFRHCVWAERLRACNAWSSATNT